MPDPKPGDPDYDESLNEKARNDPNFNPRDQVASDASGSIDNQLKAAGLDKLNDPTIKDDIMRNISYAQNAGKDPQSIINNIIAKNKLRFDNAPNSDYHADGHGGYLTPQAAPAQATSQYSSSSGGASAAGAPSTGQSAPTGNNDFLTSMRGILTSQLGELQKPVSADDPGVRDVLAAQRLAGQRSAERQRSALAERLASEGVADSGALDTGVSGILQNQGAQEQQAVGQALGHELDARRSQLQNLLNLAVQSGDAESARTLAAELQKMQMAQQESQFSRNLDANQNNFYDDMAYRYAALQSQLNGQGFNGAAGLF